MYTIIANAEKWKQGTFVANIFPVTLQIFRAPFCRVPCSVWLKWSCEPVEENKYSFLLFPYLE